MKLQVLSDTHGHPFNLDKNADVIIHAGDFSNSLKGIPPFIEKCQKLNKPFIFCLGNHDYYHHNYQQVVKGLKEYYPNNFLTSDNSIEIDGKTFVGGTLFTNFRANRIQYSDPCLFDKHKEIAEQAIFDFNIITYLTNNHEKNITANNYVTLFNQYYNNINQYRNKKDIVVVTHFPPHLACLDPYWGNHPTSAMLNPYFINDLDVKGFDLWISGHTHTAVDTVVDDCRLLINPLGYAKEQMRNGFRPNLLIEV